LKKWHRAEIFLERFATEGDSPVRIPMFGEEVSRVVRVGILGSTRGDLVIGKLSCDINEHVSGHVLAEAFLPGNYYFDGADGYAWLRVELMFSF
jgi:hypothetical protein